MNGRTKLWDVTFLGEDRCKIGSDEGDLFYRGELKEQISRGSVYEITCHEEEIKGKIRIILDTFTLIPQIKPCSETLKLEILKAIWRSPALATQPGNKDETVKIALKWAEESLQWLQK